MRKMEFEKWKFEGVFSRDFGKWSQTVQHEEEKGFGSESGNVKT